MKATQFVQVVTIFCVCNGFAMAEGKIEFAPIGEVQLPTNVTRKVIGAWVSSPTDTCARRFEQIESKIYDVIRCPGDNADRGIPITRVAPDKFSVPTSTTGKYFLILKNGDLSIWDKGGRLSVETRQSSSKTETLRESPIATSKEDPKTAGLNCFDAGYRYGYTAQSTMLGKKVKPDWDFATPARCLNDPEKDKGMLAGIRAAR